MQRFEASTRTTRIVLCERKGQVVILAADNKDVEDLNAKTQSELNEQHCSALRLRLEPPGLCCANGKVKLPF